MLHTAVTAVRFAAIEQGIFDPASIVNRAVVGLEFASRGEK